MSSTLAKRVTECMLAKGLTNAELARLCEVKPPTAFNWANGKTLNIKAAPLHLAAAAFGVTTTWLATGTGPKYPPHTGNAVVAMQDGPPYIKRNRFDIWTTEAIAIMEALPANHKQGAVANLRTYVHNLEPPAKRTPPAPDTAAA